MGVSIPGSSAVDSAFRRLAKQLKALRKRVNSLGAKQMSSADYDTAQQWIEVGRAVGEFAGRVDAFAQEWKGLVKATKLKASANRGSAAAGGKVNAPKRTPAWKFCKPALQAVASRPDGGTMDEVLSALAQSLASILTPSDLAVAPRQGVPRWHSSVRRAYKQCQQEGWVERRKDGVWKLTPKGKALIEQG